MTDIEKRKLLLWGGIDNTTIPTMNAEKEKKIIEETGKQQSKDDVDHVKSGEKSVEIAERERLAKKQAGKEQSEADKRHFAETMKLSGLKSSIADLHEKVLKVERKGMEYERKNGQLIKSKGQLVATRTREYFLQGLHMTGMLKVQTQLAKVIESATHSSAQASKYLEKQVGSIDAQATKVQELLAAKIKAAGADKTAIEKAKQSAKAAESNLAAWKDAAKTLGTAYTEVGEIQVENINATVQLQKAHQTLGSGTFQDMTKEMEAQLDRTKAQADYIYQVTLPAMTEKLALMAKEMKYAKANGDLTEEQVKAYDEMVEDVADLEEKGEVMVAQAEANVEQAKLLSKIHGQVAAGTQLIVGPFEKVQSILESNPLGKWVSTLSGLDSKMKEFSSTVSEELTSAFTPPQVDQRIDKNGKKYFMDLETGRRISEETYDSQKKNGQGLQEAFGSIQEKATKSIDAISSSFSQMNAMMGGMLGPALAIVAVLMIAKKVAEMFFGGMMDTRKELGVTVAEAGKLQNSINSTAMEFSLLGVSAEDVAGISDSIRDNMGGLSSVTSENLSAMTQLTALYGISGENTGILAAQMMAVGASSVDAATSQMESVALLARANGVAPAAVMNDVAGSADAFAGFAKEGGENVFKAAIAARKLGLDMAAVEQIADSLLDFESSINAQMEASMLIGRNINTDKARELALAGDLEGMQKEVTKQIGSAADFEKLNVVQRKSLAAAFGVSVSELGKMVANQDKLNNMTAAEKGHRDKMAKVMEWLGKAWTGFLSVGKALLPVVVGLGVALAVAFWPITLALTVITGIGMLFNELNKKVPMLGTVLGVILGLMTAIWMKSKLTGEAMSGGMMKGAKGMVTGLKEKLTGRVEEVTGGGGGDKTKKATRKKKSTSRKGGGKGKGPLGGMFEKFDAKKALAGAAALLIIAAALWVTAKALIEFGKVSWGAMAKAGVALLGLVLVLAAIGAIMMSGVGALAIIAGAAAMLIMAAALLVLGVAIQAIGKGFDMLAQGLGSFLPTIMTLAPMAKAIFVLAGAFTALGYSMAAMALGALALLPALPVLIALNKMGMLGGSVLGGGGGEETAAAEGNPVEIKLDETNQKLERLIGLMGEQGPIALATSQTKTNTGKIASQII
jgi:hypothetical protein